MFTAALFTIAKTWKQISMNRWIDKEDGVYIHNGIFRHQKEWNNAICSNVDELRDYHTKWSQTEKEKNHMIPLIHGI